MIESPPQYLSTDWPLAIWIDFCIEVGLGTSGSFWSVQELLQKIQSIYEEDTNCSKSGPIDTTNLNNYRRGRNKPGALRWGYLKTAFLENLPAADKESWGIKLDLVYKNAESRPPRDRMRDVDNWRTRFCGSITKSNKYKIAWRKCVSELISGYQPTPFNSRGEEENENLALDSPLITKKTIDANLSRELFGGTQHFQKVLTYCEKNKELFFDRAEKKTLQGYVLSPPKSSLVCITGNSGSGKSTLLRQTAHFSLNRQELKVAFFIAEDLYKYISWFEAQAKAENEKLVIFMDRVETNKRLESKNNKTFIQLINLVKTVKNWTLFFVPTFQKDLSANQKDSVPKNIQQLLSLIEDSSITTLSTSDIRKSRTQILNTFNQRFPNSDNLEYLEELIDRPAPIAQIGALVTNDIELEEAISNWIENAKLNDQQSAALLAILLFRCSQVRLIQRDFVSDTLDQQILNELTGHGFIMPSSGSTVLGYSNFWDIQLLSYFDKKNKNIVKEVFSFCAEHMGSITPLIRLVRTAPPELTEEYLTEFLLRISKLTHHAKLNVTDLIDVVNLLSQNQSLIPQSLEEVLLLIIEIAQSTRIQHPRCVNNFSLLEVLIQQLIEDVGLSITCPKLYQQPSWFDYLDQTEYELDEDTDSDTSNALTYRSIDSAKLVQTLHDDFNSAATLLMTGKRANLECNSFRYARKVTGSNNFPELSENSVQQIEVILNQYQKKRNLNYAESRVSYWLMSILFATQDRYRLLSQFQMRIFEFAKRLCTQDCYAEMHFFIFLREAKYANLLSLIEIDIPTLINRNQLPYCTFFFDTLLQFKVISTEDGSISALEEHLFELYENGETKKAVSIALSLFWSKNALRKFQADPHKQSIIYELINDFISGVHEKVFYSYGTREWVRDRKTGSETYQFALHQLKKGKVKEFSSVGILNRKSLDIFGRVKNAGERLSNIGAFLKKMNQTNSLGKVLDIWIVLAQTRINDRDQINIEKFTQLINLSNTKLVLYLKENYEGFALCKTVEQYNIWRSHICNESLPSSMVKLSANTNYKSDIPLHLEFERRRQQGKLAYWIVSKYCPDRYPKKPKSRNNAPIFRQKATLFNIGRQCSYIEHPYKIKKFSKNLYNKEEGNTDLLFRNLEKLIFIVKIYWARRQINKGRSFINNQIGNRVLALDKELQRTSNQNKRNKKFIRLLLNVVALHSALADDQSDSEIVWWVHLKRKTRNNASHSLKRTLQHSKTLYRADALIDHGKAIGKQITLTNNF